MFFGPLDDIPEPDTFLPLIDQGQFCAACHTFSFWGTPIYQSFAEWLASPYPSQGVHCQTCHMPPDGVTTNFVPGHGGVERDPQTIPSHFQFGTRYPEFLQSAVSVTVQAAVVSGRIRATVTITNTGAGHDYPTDQPARHLILVVRAMDAGGADLTQVAGETVPVWCGVGDAPDDYGGRPGKAFAKVLRSLNTGEEPTAAYWSPHHRRQRQPHPRAGVRHVGLRVCRAGGRRGACGGDVDLPPRVQGAYGSQTLGHAGHRAGAGDAVGGQ